jgi:broad specificity phosphatase PhoE
LLDSFAHLSDGVGIVHSESEVRELRHRRGGIDGVQRERESGPVANNQGSVFIARRFALVEPEVGLVEATGLFLIRDDECKVIEIHVWQDSEDGRIDNGIVAIELIFETHSITTDNEAGVATGWNHGRLSDRGRALAVELGKRRSDVDVVFSSDLGRAVETVEIALNGSDIPVELDRRLRECNYGDWNGMPVEKLEAERPGRVVEPFSGGESYQNVVARMADFLEDIAPRRNGRQVLVVGHTATRWALDHLLNGADLAEQVRSPFEWREGWRYVLPDGRSVQSLVAQDGAQKVKGADNTVARLSCRFATEAFLRCLT